jgi:cyclohexa-1,5-dienecarbonyl-CoA hydratase
MSSVLAQVRVEPGAVCRVVIDRPPLNVLSTALLDELDAALASAFAHGATKVVVLSGEGRGFCAGVDVADHTPDRVDAMIHAFRRVVDRLLGAQMPVVAAVHGAALGGGLELALACDLVLAAEGSRLGQPEIGLGVFPPAAAALLPRLVGRQAALDLILTGRVLSPAEAKAMGLVTHVLPGGDFAAAAADYAASLAAQSRPVLRLAKRAVLAGLERPLDAALTEADRIYLDELMRLRDPAEGLAAFLEKREPVWSER